MKLTKYLAAAAMAMLAIGCAKEQVGSETPDGQEINVTFNASLPEGIQTRAIGDGTTAKELVVAVYDNATGNELKSLRQTKEINLRTTVEFNLVKGKTYSFVFWAQAKDNSYYNITDMRNIIVDYTGKNANDETRDAFFATRMDLKVTGAMNETVELHRPFAQVNFGTTKDDFNAAKAAGFEPTLSSFTATAAATVFDPVTGEGKNGIDISLTENNLPVEDLKVKIGGVENTYKWMAMNYFIPEGKIGEKQVSNVTATFTAGTQTVTISAPNAPVRSNYRTNILGSLLTDQTIFNVIIDPVFNEVDKNDTDYSDSPDYIYNKLALAFANGGVVDLTEDVAIDETLIVPAEKSVVLNLNGKTITNNGKGSTIKVKGNLTIGGNGTIDGGKGGDNNAIEVNAGGEVVIENGTFKVGPDASGIGNSCIYANGGSVIIYDGYFSTEAAYKNFYYVLNQSNGNPGTIIVYGGQFENYDPKVGDDNLGGNFIADGYKSTKISDSPEVYVVTKADVTPVTNQEGLNAALKSEGGVVSLPANTEFELPTGNSIAEGVEICGQEGTVLKTDASKKGTSDYTYNAEGLNNVTFKNLTILEGQGNYNGIKHSDNIKYENCTIVGRPTMYIDHVTYTNCVFEQDIVDYNIWTYGAQEITFDNCTFKCKGKAVLVYKDGGVITSSVTFNNCKFEASESAGKAAIEIDSYNASYTININNCTLTGDTSNFTKLYNVKRTIESVTVNVNGTEDFKFVK